MRALEAVLLQDKALAVSYSGGKDSATCANLALNAGLRVLRDAGYCPAIHLLNADTLIENPVVRSLADRELAKVVAFGTRQGLDVQLHVATPTLSSSWPVRVIGGRALPSFASSRADCTTDLKLAGLERIKSRLRAKEGAGRLVTVIGTRRDESTQRALATTERGECAHTTWFGPEGDERLSPILDWSTDEVWTYLGEAAAGMHPAYSDFTELMAFYGAAGNSSCAVVADMRAAAHSKPCGARAGCAFCLRVSADRSAENMVEHEPEKYAFLAPLLRLRNFLADVQWRWDLRNYVGRTIDAAGMVTIRPDQYSPDFCKQLLRYLLTAQDDANRLGAPAPFRALGLRELVAIDFFWSLRALHPPYTALAVYLEHRQGKREECPVVTYKSPPSPCTEVGKVHVGTSWDEDWHPMRPTGLRHAVWESFNESCGPDVRTGSKGQVFMDLPEDVEFDVDEEGAAMFLDFEAERKVAQYRDYRGDWTTGAMEYLTYGCVTLAKGQSSAIDSMLRRAQWLQRHDLHGQRSVEELRERCSVRFARQHDLFA
jgi:DNA sulfur modification protein DndC